MKQLLRLMMKGPKRFLITPGCSYMCVMLLCCCSQAQSVSITIRADAARASLDALNSPDLSREEALKVANMAGNQAAIRKLHEFKLSTTTDDFANALYAAAHNQKVTTRNEKAVLFDLVKPKTAEIGKVVDEIVSNPDAFQDPIQRRIQRFSPQNANIRLKGEILAAGDGAGYTFGATDFYVNLGVVHNLPFIAMVTTHELYHAVQGAYADKRKAPGDDAPGCRDIAHLFANLYEEGSANFVEDIPRILDLQDDALKQAKEDFATGLKEAQGNARLLELSVSSLEAAPKAVPYDEVYAAGFFGHGPLYSIGYVMVRDIEQQDGDQAVIDMLQKPPYTLILRYIQLQKYGKAKDHPTLYPNTIAAAQRLAEGCHE